MRGLLHFTGALLITALVLGIAGCAKKSDPVPVTILHWNDLHSQNTPRRWIEDDDTLMVGGMANLAGMISHYRDSINHPVVVLNAGDEFQGTPISAVTKGHSQITLVNAIGVDAFTVGNHEFDYTAESLVEGMKKAEFPVLLANVKDLEGRLLFEPYTIIERNGIKIGVIGVVLDELKSVTTHTATKFVQVEPAIETVKKYLAELTPQTDIQICLSHMGVQNDSVLAMAVGKDLELIIGGHTHTRLEEPWVVNGVPILQAGGKGSHLGIATLQIDTLANDLVDLDARIEQVVEGRYPQHPEVAALVDSFEALVAEEMDVVVATLDDPWIRKRGEESNVGRFVAGCIRWASDADVGVVNTSGLRANVDEGPLTVREVFQVCPFGNDVVRFTMTGRELREWLLKMVRGEVSHVQQSGITAEVTPEGIVSMEVKSVAVDPEKEYTIATLNYVSDHMDTYFDFQPGSRAVENTYLVDREVVLDGARRTGRIRSPEKPQIKIVE